MRFTIEMLPARQGDALWIEYGEKPHRILFDAGKPETAQHVRTKIESLDEDDRHFELLVVSHIDTDHIGGAVPLLADEELGATYGDIWFNGQRHLREALQPMGPAEGDRLTELLEHGLPWNERFGSGAVAVPDTGAPPCVDFHGMKVTVLSPYLDQLKALRGVWPELLRAHGLVEGEEATAEPELAPGLQALGPPPPPAVPADVADLEALAARPFKPDPALPNGSSIAVLLEYGECSVLLGGDAHAPVLLRGVDQLLEARGESTLRLDAFKLPHHGSKANLHLPLLERLECRRHLISTDGTNTRHPNVETIARVLKSSPGSELVFNYHSKWNAVWEDAEVIARSGYAATFPAAGAKGIVVDVTEPPKRPGRDQR